ncbi:MAG TPA: glutaminase [Noviherbaspirillum sp.]|uniref:glutaminase n=1 Tax=Noviherbaspirillum sp. TaxID=1926288 RepID=UPI002DDCA8CC|nr:glutaminase [Noviherbaspirillum sp.]HEV2609916.1 glutaminase [Noviherbaspirillum sp.]
MSDIIKQSRQSVGKFWPADYIQALARRHPDQSGLALVNPRNGKVVSAGDAKIPVSIQSVSKLPNAILLGMHVGFGDGPGQLWDIIGKTATGQAFNADKTTPGKPWKPMNPCVNIGALAVMNGICEHFPDDERPEYRLRDLLRELSGDDSIDVDEAVAMSEYNDSENNRRLLQKLDRERQKVNSTYPNAPEDRKFKEIDIDRVLRAYCRQCAIVITPEKMAKALWTLEHGKDKSGKPYIAGEALEQMKEVMRTAGAYDQAGDVSTKTSGKAKVKTGVGGLIAGWIRDKKGRDIPVCTFDPSLNTHGNSKGGLAMLGALSRLNLAFPARNHLERLLEDKVSTIYAPKESPESVSTNLLKQLDKVQQIHLKKLAMAELSPAAREKINDRSENGFYLKRLDTTAGKSLPLQSKTLLVADGVDGKRRTYTMIDDHHIEIEHTGEKVVKGAIKIVVTDTPDAELTADKSAQKVTPT